MSGGEVVTMLLVKAAIWIVALASGTSGGVLAPLLILGGSLGALEGMALPGDTGFWALLGMAAMMGGTMRAPLTGAFFALELTGDAAALPAILAATAAAYAVTVLLLKRSILTEKIARHGHHVVREYAVDPFELMRVADVMVRDVESLPSDMPVDEAVAFFSSDRSRHKSYPVVDADRRLVGLVTRSDVLRWVGEGPHEGQALAELVAADTPTTGRAEEMIATLADRMIANDRGRAPIIDAEGRLVGLVSRKDLLMVRARAGAQEAERNAFFRVGPGGNGRKRKAAADAKPKRAKSKA
jgi:CBS domain-containing protein